MNQVMLFCTKIALAWSESAYKQGNGQQRCSPWFKFQTSLRNYSYCAPQRDSNASIIHCGWIHWFERIYNKSVVRSSFHASRKVQYRHMHCCSRVRNQATAPCRLFTAQGLRCMEMWVSIPSTIWRMFFISKWQWEGVFFTNSVKMYPLDLSRQFWAP